MPSTYNYQREVRDILHSMCNSWNHTGLVERRAEQRDHQPLSRLMEKLTMLVGRLLRVEGIIGRKENPLNTFYCGKVTLMKKGLEERMIS